MNKKLENIAIEHGDKLKVISIERLNELKDILETFKVQEELNNFQKWIVSDMYQFETPKVDFLVNSIILIAVHHPFCAKVEFVREGKKKLFLSMVCSDFNETDLYLRKFVVENGYTIQKANNLPLKRLGAHCGLAQFGRNNITYVDGLGSNFSYVAYFSDMICEEDTWGKMKNAVSCNTCNLCLDNCPTGAIRKDRFLIDNQKCLSCINECPGEFPDWIPITAHHTLYDCLICQRVCPMNCDQLEKVIETISFSEEETDMLLNGKPIDSFSKDFREKIYLLGLNTWYDAIPRNLKTLFDM